jgi:hypothetical protein
MFNEDLRHRIYTFICLLSRFFRFLQIELSQTFAAGHQVEKLFYVLDIRSYSKLQKFLS